MSGADENTRNDTVRVGTAHRSLFYVNSVLRRLHSGEPTVTVTALGFAIGEAVSVVEILKNREMAVVVKVGTSREAKSDSRSGTVEKIEFVVSKAPKFDELYAQHEKEREERQAQRASQSGDAAAATTSA